jgi:hypothetical protein
MDSSVSIMTGYGLEYRGPIPDRGCNISLTIQTGSGVYSAPPPPMQWLPLVLCRSDRSIELTNHFHLMRKLMREVQFPLTCTSAWRVPLLQTRTLLIYSHILLFFLCIRQVKSKHKVYIPQNTLNSVHISSFYFAFCVMYNPST